MTNERLRRRVIARFSMLPPFRRCGSVAMTPLRTIALHESAHCCVARLFGIEVVLATVDRADPHVITRCRHGDTTPMLEKLAIIDLAGTVLEPEPKRCSQDERHALERCMQIEATDAPPRMIHWPADRRLKEQLRDRARQLVADHLAQSRRCGDGACTRREARPVADRCAHCRGDLVITLHSDRQHVAAGAASS